MVILDIKDIIKNGENKTVEFKEIIPSSKKISQTAVAFANGAGGKIFIGITDDRQIIGIDEKLDIFKTIDDLNTIIYDSLCFASFFSSRSELLKSTTFYSGNCIF